MYRKLLILGAIAALFTIVTAVPASAIAVETGPDKTPQTVLDNEPIDGEVSHNAHGPICGALNDGAEKPCPNNKSAAGAITPAGLADNPMGGANLGAWNAVFQSNDDSAICGVVVIDDVCV